MDLPVALGDRLDVQQPVLAALSDRFGTAAAQPLPIDAAVYHHMCHVQAQRAVLACHALRNGAQTGFGRSEMREARLAAEAGRGAREDDCAAAERDEAPRRFPPYQEAGEAADAPEFLEGLDREVAKVEPLVVAGIGNDEVGRGA